MPENTFSTCVYYYSLPEFPENCRIVRNNALLIRDILVCNRNNPHIEYGGQYDPHYEHRLAPEFKMCWKETRRKIMSLVDDDSYDNIYLFFRTRRVHLSKPDSQCVSGYYDIDLDKVRIDPNYGEPVLYAKEARFVSSQNAIDLSKFLAKYPNPRFPFSSETKKGALTNHFTSWLTQLEKRENRLDDYIDMTKKLDQTFRYHEFEEGTYPVCRDCGKNDRCPLAIRIRTKGKLFHQIPEDIAARINNHYKRTLKIA